MDHTTIFPGFKIEFGGVEIGAEYIEFSKCHQYPLGVGSLSTFQNPERYVCAAQNVGIVDHLQQLLLSRGQLLLHEEMLKRAKHEPLSDFSILEEIMGDDPYPLNIRRIVTAFNLVYSIDCFGEPQIRAVYKQSPVSEEVYGQKYLFTDKNTRDVLSRRLNIQLGKYSEVLNELNETLRNK